MSGNVEPEETAVVREQPVNTFHGNGYARNGNVGSGVLYAVRAEDPVWRRVRILPPYPCE
jgi:hypothetical protein